MSKFHATTRELLEDVYLFLTKTLQSEVLSSTSLTHKGRILLLLKNLQKEYPELHLQFGESSESLSDSKRCSIANTLSYVDMNGDSPYKIPFISSIDKENYDICMPKEKCDSPENHSITGSEDYGSDDSKCLSEVSASDLYACDKSGYLDKKKRDSIKGWLNPFQKRWCAIKEGVLYYYEKTTDRKQKGSIILGGYEARALPDDCKEGRKYNHCFELVCPGRRTYQFSAPSDRDMKQWIEAIEKNNKIFFQGRQSQILPSSPKLSEQPCTLASADDIYEVVEDRDSETPDSDPGHTDNICLPKGSEQLLLHEEDSHEQGLNFSEWYVGLWDCSGSDDTELSFHRGDLIRIISKEFDNFSWWIGELQGKEGLVPKSYLIEAYESY